MAGLFGLIMVKTDFYSENPANKDVNKIDQMGLEIFHRLDRI
jgi:hypothetical protein